MMKQTINVKGFKPTEAQKEIIRFCTDAETKYIVSLFGRQCGKTFSAQNIILKWGLENPNTNLMWVSPYFSQAKKVFNDTMKLMKGTGLVTESNKTDLQITLLSGSIIMFKSAENENALRGYTLDYAIIDEAAFMKESLWSQVIKPTLLVKGKKVLFITTPKGKNWIFDLAQMGLSGEHPTYKTIHATSYSSPFITKEELDEFEKTLPEHIFRQEILAEFIDDSGSVFQNLDKVCVLPGFAEYDPKNKYYGGLDFGRQNDYTVLSILDQNGNLVYQYKDRYKSWDIIIRQVVQILQKYQAQAFGEINGVGDPVFQQIRKMYPKIQPFTTTNDSKQEIIEELIMSFNEQTIKLPNKDVLPELYQELQIFTYEYSTQTRRIKYSSPKGFHDDQVLSLAIAKHALKKKINYGVYALT